MTDKKLQQEWSKNTLISYILCKIIIIFSTNAFQFCLPMNEQKQKPFNSALKYNKRFPKYVYHDKLDGKLNKILSISKLYKLRSYTKNIVMTISLNIQKLFAIKQKFYYLSSYNLFILIKCFVKIKLFLIHPLKYRL